MDELKEQYHVASFSGGKDSTAMVLHMIEQGDHLDEVIFCDTTMEFPAMMRHIAKVKALVESAGIKFTTLQAEHDFEYYMLHHEPNRKKTELQGRVGYSWPGPRQRWCTRALKVQIINKYLSQLRQEYDVVQYKGIAADEGYRLERKGNQMESHRHPLVEWGWTEADALAYCYKKGLDWEGLYELFNRVSCWCCPLQPLEELRTLRKQFPDLWQRLADLDARTWRDFKDRGQSVENLDKRFALEDALIRSGHSIKGKQFFTDLNRLLENEATIEEILQERDEAQLSLFDT